MTQDIKKLIKEFTSLFRQAREAHEQFTKDWNENFPKSGQAYKKTDLYTMRLSEMRRAEHRVESKILPIIEELKSGSIINVELAVAYLAVDDRYFHSGYNKEAIIKFLKRIKLSKDQKVIIENIWQTTEASLGERGRKVFIKLLETF